MNIKLDDGTVIPMEIFMQSLEFVKDDIRKELDNDIINKMKAVMNTTPEECE